MPDSTVWPVSGSVRTTSDGSSSASRPSADARRPVSVPLSASTATETTGSATPGGSRTSGAPGAHRVEPARADFSPTTATMSPATARSTWACRSARTRRIRPIRSARRAVASHTVSPFSIVPAYRRR
ncbi:hypothetical protein SGRIM128S_09401 [Streptomyces griseomycini]